MAQQRSSALPEPEPHPQPEQDTAQTRRRLGDVLVATGVISDDELTDALAAQRTGRRRRLGQIVVERGLLDEEQLARALADLLGLPVLDLAAEDVDPEAARLVPRHVAERTRTLVVRVEEDGVMLVAAADPTDVVALDDVRAYTRASSLRVAIATERAIRRRLREIWGVIDEAGSAAEPEDAEESAADARVDDAPVVRMTTELITEAIRLGASDVHVEPQAEGLRIRYRVDGLLRDAAWVPKSMSAAVVSRLKIISGMDIAERRRPQDGRVAFPVDGTQVDARVSTLPALHGEKVVIRLLTGSDVPDLADLGLDDDQRTALLAAAKAPQGLIVLTGPTGSGKTHTLYALLKEIASPERNVITLEDPVEIRFPGITQVQVNERAGLTFATGLRAILRQDPDIILVGEIRDTPTAELAVRAALTGHLVLTTLHTLDAPGALTRLVDMGVPAFLVASSLTAVVAQRLVRRPCPRCVTDVEPDDDVLRAASVDAGVKLRMGTGCESCGQTGYQGRIGVFEVLTVDRELRAQLAKSADEETLRGLATAKGMTTLRASAIRAALAGSTTLEEVARVCAT